MNPIKFVSPCCRKPIDLKSLDDVAVVLLPPEEDGCYGWNTRCCQDLRDSSETMPREVEFERKLVYEASIKAAEAELESRIAVLRNEFNEHLDEFEHQHDPSIDRVFVFAIFGEDQDSGRIVGNYRVGEADDKDEANIGFCKLMGELKSQGYEEIAYGNSNMIMFERLLKYKTFKLGHKLRIVGLWKERVRSGNGGPPYDHATASGMYDHF